MKKFLSIFCTMILCVVFLSSCGEGGGASSSSNTSDSSNNSSTGEVGDYEITQLNEAKSYARNTKSLANSDNMSAYNAFSGTFLQTAYVTDRQNGSSENIVVSPLSMFLACALCFDGASGQTLTEFESAFGMTKSQSAEFSSSLYNRYVERNYLSSKVGVANSVWLDNTYEQYVKQGYLSDATKYFNAQIFSANFKSEKTVDGINSWVSKSTDGLIDRIIDRISDESTMDIVNALLLESEWSDQWTMTIPHDFTNLSGEKIQKEFLTREKKVFYESENADAFIENLSDSFAFLAIKPKDGVNAKDYFSSLDWSEISSILANPNSDYDVETGIPEFAFDYSIDLKTVMQKMGIQKALSKSQADFSGMLEVPNKNVFINSALQKSHIELDKNGIKAAAATSIMIDATTSLPQERPKKEIWLDSSFAFVILDRGAIDGNVLNIPLFMGIVENF